MLEIVSVACKFATSGRVALRLVSRHEWIALSAQLCRIQVDPQRLSDVQTVRAAFLLALGGHPLILGHGDVAKNSC